MMKYSPDARIARYPAKMAGKLVDQIFVREPEPFLNLHDPFCGSGETLLGAISRGIPATGTDVNPYAVLLASVRTSDFDHSLARETMAQFAQCSRYEHDFLEIRWHRKEYWFSDAVLRRLESMRKSAVRMNLVGFAEGRSVLLAAVQSVRLASRADNRSPKPFISKSARRHKVGRYRDPIRISQELHESQLKAHTTLRRIAAASVWLHDAANIEASAHLKSSHVITSPPYLNAQDYFRNSLLELYFLEDLLPFQIDSLKGRFIGTERNLGTSPEEETGEEEFRYLSSLDSSLGEIASRDSKGSVIAYRYFADMKRAVAGIKSQLEPGGVVWMVAGDNVCSGVVVPTTKILFRLMRDAGFMQTAGFVDSIKNRALAPKRQGHVALIKAETAGRFVLS